MKRFVAALLALMGLVYVLSLFLSAYGLFISRGWWVVEPWLGERPEIVYHDTFSGSAWRVKADKARIQEMVQRLQAEPIEYPAYDYDEAFAHLCLDRHYSTAAYRTPHRCRLMTPNGWVLTEDSVCDIWELTDGYAYIRLRDIGDAERERVDYPAPSFPFLYYLMPLAAIGVSFGPALPVAGALYLLPLTKSRRRRPVVLLPLLHLLYLLPCLYILERNDSAPVGTPPDYTLILAAALLWCVFSLLQSSVAAAVLSRIPHFSPRHA